MDFSDNNIFMVEWDYLYNYTSEDGYHDTSDIRTTGQRFESREEAVHFVATKLTKDERNIKLFELNNLELKIDEVMKDKIVTTLEGEDGTKG